MEWVIALVVVAVLGVAAMAAAGGMGEMAREPVYDTFGQDLPADRPLRAADLQNLRFGVAFRGYSMRQVDDLLDRLSREIADREAAIAEPVGEDAGPEPVEHHVGPERAERDSQQNARSGERT